MLELNEKNKTAIAATRLVSAGVALTPVDARRDWKEGNPFQVIIPGIGTMVKSLFFVIHDYFTRETSRFQKAICLHVMVFCVFILLMLKL